MSISKQSTEILANDVSGENDSEYESLVSLFGGFIVSESMELSESDFETPEINALHDVVWEKMSEGFSATGFFVNSFSYDTRVRLCRKLFQRLIEIGLDD